MQERKMLDCRICQTECKVGGDVISVLCWRCLTGMVAGPESSNAKPDEKRPRGWHKKPEYISPSGKVYKYGKLLDEATNTNTVGNTERDVPVAVPAENPDPPVKRGRGRPRKIQQ